MPVTRNRVDRSSSPGANGSSGAQLGYAEITSTPAGVTAVGSGSRVDLDSGLVITVTVGSRPICLEAWCGNVVNNTAANGFGMAIVEGTIGGGVGTALALATGTSAIASAAMPLIAKRSLSPSAGSHTYKVMAWAVLGGTATFTAATNARIYIKATEE